MQRKGDFMSLTVNIYYTGAPGAAKAFAEEMVSTGTVAAIRQESGNLRYEYFFPMERPDTVLLIDSWEDQEAIDRHHHTPMMAKIMELREKYDLHMQVERYISTAEVPQKDAEFIRK